MMLSASRASTLRLATTMTSRSLSSQTTCAMEKLKSAFEHYRQENYTQELPIRFKKDIVRAAAVDEKITTQSIERVLHNIKAHASITKEELQSIFNEIGDANGEIESQKMVQLL